MADLRGELQTIYEEYGRLTPELVVAAARPRNHPLHARVFDKSQKEAAEAHYRENARQLIKEVRITYRPAKGGELAKTVRAFTAIPDGEGFAYKPTEEVAADPFMRKLAIQTMEREWKNMYERYGDMVEFVELVTGDLKKKKKAG